MLPPLEWLTMAPVKPFASLEALSKHCRSTGRIGKDGTLAFITNLRDDGRYR